MGAHEISRQRDLGGRSHRSPFAFFLGAARYFGETQRRSRRNFGNFASPRAAQSVTIRRDRWGVPHIYAQNQHDLFFAQGFVAAQDRLFQMEMWKRAGQGRLAEVLGAASFHATSMRACLRYRGDMRAEYESYSPDTRDILEAFTAGINAYITSLLGAEDPGGLPIEFQLAGFNPTPWRPEDCLNRMAAFSMTNNAFAELLHAQLLAAIGRTKPHPCFTSTRRQARSCAGHRFFRIVTVAC